MEMYKPLRVSLGLMACEAGVTDSSTHQIPQIFSNQIPTWLEFRFVFVPKVYSKGFQKVLRFHRFSFGINCRTTCERCIYILGLYN